MAALTLYTAPTAEPVTLQEVKDYLRLDGSDDDAILSTLIAASRLHAETFTRRALMTQTWKLTLDAFPWNKQAMRSACWEYCDFGFPSCGGAFLLPLPPLQSVTHIKYYDTSNVQQTLSAALYQVDALSEPARVAPAYNQSWPSTYSIYNAVELQFVCGYTSATLVPAGIRMAILMLVSHWFDDCDGDATKGVPMAVDTLLTQHRYMRLV